MSLGVRVHASVCVRARERVVYQKLSGIVQGVIW